MSRLHNSFSFTLFIINRSVNNKNKYTCCIDGIEFEFIQCVLKLVFASESQFNNRKQLHMECFKKEKVSRNFSELLIGDCKKMDYFRQ